VARRTAWPIPTRCREFVARPYDDHGQHDMFIAIDRDPRPVGPFANTMRFLTREQCKLRVGSDVSNTFRSSVAIRRRVRVLCSESGAAIMMSHDEYGEVFAPNGGRMLDLRQGLERLEALS
jgi:hypothetical protein